MNQSVSVAPMMDWTTRHCRYFHRLLSPHVHLYTEMVTTGALIHGDRERFLRRHKGEDPVALQLGGHDARDLAECAKMGEDKGDDEINLNNGCLGVFVHLLKFLSKTCDYMVCVIILIVSICF